MFSLNSSNDCFNLLIQEEWKQTFDGGTAIALILAFLWGSVLFIFKVATGLQVLIRVACDEDPYQKIYPVAQGIGTIRAYYTEHFKQLSVVLLISEIVSFDEIPVRVLESEFKNKMYGFDFVF